VPELCLLCHADHFIVPQKKADSARWKKQAVDNQVYRPFGRAVEGTEIIAIVGQMGVLNIPRACL